MNDFQFNYDDLVPINYKVTQSLINDLEQILQNTKNLLIDWKKRESSLKKIGQICLGDQGNSEIFLRIFNSQISTNLGIQLADLRSSLMKEACRITSLCARELGILMEQSALYLLSKYVLFKIAGSANRVISDSSSKCILNLVKYVTSIKVINNICEQKTMKSNFVRNICAQCILYIVSCYKKILISKTSLILQETMKTLISDPNGEVRATTRRAFITYWKRFEFEGDELFENLEKNVQKQVNEDKKKYWDNIVINEENGVDNIIKCSKSKSTMSFGCTNKSKSHEIKCNLGSSLNSNNSGSIKNIKSEEIENMSKIDMNSGQLSYETEFSENAQNEQSLKSKGLKSFQGKDSIKKNNHENIKISKSNNQELVKKVNNQLNISEYSCSNLMNSNNSESDIHTKENKIEVQPFRMSKKNKSKPKNINNENHSKKIIINNYIQNNYINNNKINNNLQFQVDKNSVEYKLIDKINQLTIYNEPKEKLKIFQYLFNIFSNILSDVKNISDITLRQFVDIHIEYLIFEDKFLTEQIIKNLMRMIFYLTQIFKSDDIQLIVKILMIKINLKDKTISKLSYELLDIIRKKRKVEDIYNGIFNLLEENNVGQNDVCYEFLTFLVIYSGNILEDNTYFNKIFELICNCDVSSTKIGNLIEALYKNNPNNFISLLKSEKIDIQKKIMHYLDKNKTNQTSNDQNSSGQEKNEKEIELIKNFIENGNYKSFIEFIENNSKCLPVFFMFLSNEKFSNTKYNKNIINFIYSLVSNPNKLADEISKNMNILLEQLIKFFIINIKNSLIVDMIKEILFILPMNTSYEVYFKNIAKYLNSKTNQIVLQHILMNINNNIMNDKAKDVENYFPYFIKEMFNLINHQSNEIKKCAIFCCTQLYSILGNKFNSYLDTLPQNHKNLIILLSKGNQ